VTQWPRTNSSCEEQGSTQNLKRCLFVCLFVTQYNAGTKAGFAGSRCNLGPGEIASAIQKKLLKVEKEHTTPKKQLERGGEREREGRERGRACSSQLAHSLRLMRCCLFVTLYNAGTQEGFAGSRSTVKYVASFASAI